MKQYARRMRQRGFSMIEVLVTLVILMVGLLGLVGLVVSSQKNEMESYQRVQAVLLLRDMVNRINANTKAAPCYVSTGTGSASYYGSGSTATPICSSGSTSQKARALADLAAWDNLLKGASETVGGANAGAMQSARGCVTYDATSGSYYVQVAWQGLTPTYAPVAGNDCASGTYGNEKQRRVVSAAVQFGAMF